MQEISINEARGAMGAWPQSKFEKSINETHDSNTPDATLFPDDSSPEEKVRYLEKKLSKDRYEVDQAIHALFNAYKIYSQSMNQLFTLLKQQDSGQ